MPSQEMQIGRDLLVMLPQLLAVLTAVLGLVAEMLHRPHWAFGIVLIGLLAGAALAATRLGQETTVFQGTFRIDALSTWAVVILLPATALSVALVEPEVRGTAREGTVYSLLAFTSVGALVLAGAGDLMLVVLGVLLISLGSFALVAYPGTDRATEAALKFFVFGSLAEAVMIFGLTYWFGATGSTELAELSRLAGPARLAAVAGLVGVVVGLGYEAALVPLHFWAPDAYDGAPVAVAAYVSVVPKIGALFGLAQVVRGLSSGLSNGLSDGVVDWQLLLAIVAAVSMTYGNLAALAQTSVVRLLAYSSIAQAGYFLLGVVALGQSGLATWALVVFAAAYAAMNLGAFAVVAWVGRELGAFVGFARAAPWGGVALVVFFLSLVGLPPLAGFFGKLFLFGAAVDAGYTWLAVVAILNSVLSLAVYLRVIAPAFREVRKPATPPSLAVSVVAGISLALTAVLGLASQLFVGQLG